MNHKATVTECKEPWLFWWYLLTIEERKALKQKYFSNSWPHWTTSLLADEKKEVWDHEHPDPIRDFEWLELATIASNKPIFSREEKAEIWRQVYRIASERI